MRESVTGPAQDATSELAATLRRHRLANGMSFRELARKLGLSAHSGLSDYEHGRRIPPTDLVAAYERAFELPAGTLKVLRDRAFSDRANRQRTDQPAVQSAEPESRPGRFPRLPRSRTVWLATAGVVLVLVVIGAIALLTNHPRPQPVAHTGALPAAPGDVVNLDSRGVPQPVRRSGTAVIDAGHVIDLDSSRPDWAYAQAPSDNPEDVEFTLAHRTLTGIDNAVLGVLPTGSHGTRKECGQLQAYGVEAAALKPGALMCVETDEHRYALLRVTDVRTDGFGRPDQLSVSIIVWEPQTAT